MRGDRNTSQEGKNSASQEVRSQEVEQRKRSAGKQLEARKPGGKDTIKQDRRQPTGPS
jgi:hypothetical protein